MRILGVDPGSKRSGICLLECWDESYTLESSGEVYDGVEGMIEHLDVRGGMYRPDLIVVEDYEVRRGQAGDPRGLEVIGAIKSWAYHNGRRWVKIQSPAGRKVAVSDDALKRLGLYLPGEAQRNAREAVRHAVIAAKNFGIMSILSKGWPS